MGCLVDDKDCMLRLLWLAITLGVDMCSYVCLCRNDYRHLRYCDAYDLNYRALAVQCV